MQNAIAQQLRRSISVSHGDESKLHGSRQPHPRKFHVNGLQGHAVHTFGYPARDSIVCASSPVRAPAPAQQRQNPGGGVDEVKEAHKVFDEVYIHVKSGNGGRGEIVEAERGKWVTNFKYKPGGNQAKKIWLPASTPADGADGADVFLKCDPEVDNLLHLHKRSNHAARNGSNANPSAGSAGPKKNKDIRKAKTPPLIISVPPGTVVKRKSTGAFLGELLNPGDMLLVARGGKGGSGAKAPTRESNMREMQRQYKLAAESGAEVVAVEDAQWQVETKGLPGSQLSLHLMLRVVADVGIVGFPNAGKSSLLAALSPEVASYPFTTLMPNLGVMVPESQAREAAGEEQNEFEIPGSRAGRRRDRTPVLADLPGLIEGAHKGKGLGRMFLRHLRRTHALLHVVDAAAEDPATDYYAVREELRMYNPEYCAKPHIVALNKMDLEDAGSLRDEVMAAIQLTAQRHCQEWEGEEIKPMPPVAVVACSALSGDGLYELRAAIQQVLLTSNVPVPKGAKDKRPGSSTQQSAAESKQMLSAAVAAAMAGAATLVAGEAAAEATEETASEVDLVEDERWLLGLSEEELLRLEVEDGGMDVGSSTASGNVEVWDGKEEGQEAPSWEQGSDEGVEDEGQGQEVEEGEQEWEVAEEDLPLLDLTEEELLNMVQD